MKETWKTIAIIVAVVLLIATVTIFLVSNWENLVDRALCTIQSNIGLKNHFHISAGFPCPVNSAPVTPTP